MRGQVGVFLVQLHGDRAPWLQGCSRPAQSGRSSDIPAFLATGLSRLNPLFEAQRLDRIERRCPVSWVETKTDADGRTDDKPGDSPSVGEDEIDFQPSGQQIA